jgi:ribosome biogenesis GTPase
LTEDKKLYICHIRGKVKRDMNIYVGDYVKIKPLEDEKAIIEKIYPRKNALIRPFVSNMDNLIIVVAPVPKPDWLLVDKLIVSCYIENIRPTLCFHKADLISREEIKHLTKPYEGVIRLVQTSIKDKSIGLKELYEVMQGGLSCFTGQSAVGKSSIINEILGKEVMEVCDVSPKAQRGKNTTRHIEIFDWGGGRVTDTCGFSLLELEELPPQELTYYYDEYMKLMPECRFTDCVHINEPECAVKKAVEEGSLSKERYLRYISIYNELKEKQDEKY